MLAAGIALGALLGPGPASSLASNARAAAIARTLALLALGQSTGGGGLLLSANGAATAQTQAHTTPPHAARTTPASATATQTSAAAPTSTGSNPAASQAPASSTAPTSAGNGAGGARHSGGANEAAPTRPAPIAHAWLIVLPGTGFSGALAQPAAAPYLNGLLGKGTLLSAYPSLAVGELADAATLLAGQITAAVTQLAPAACAPAGTPATATQAPAPSSTAAPAPAAGAPCPNGEAATLQADDTFLREALAPILASPAYREGGLVAITFAPASTAASGPNSGSPPAPAGSVSSSLSAAGAPAGALLLSPFLRHVGARRTTVFDELAPRRSVTELLAPGG
jgi:hypothetical protein